ncbi:hypothetical protein OF117_16400 [Geodermatophilus sp. YIM 151500]|uniref:hypothetical protein n=1 Tax=Geodermatophilus sp. YIM 151500 TaxID=2984531 RepID=UPI0021E451AF|nr:hypothetical protein [Geodermatophilus sp. YIM 151500]MCV2490937.1 hypothetical protein [Geodermatophilus sp. YIM 151500]
MTAVRMPRRGRWIWDVRGDGRAVRISAHAEAGLLVLSLWRDDSCIGTARLSPDEAARLVSGIGEGLTELARPGAGADASAGRMHELELRLAAVEHRLRTPAWRRAASAVTGWAVRKAARAGRPASASPASLARSGTPAPLATAPIA